MTFEPLKCSAKKLIFCLPIGIFSLIVQGMKIAEKRVSKDKGVQRMKFYKCMKCGQILEAVISKCDGITCCGEPVRELKANTSDGASEKHVPVVEKNGSSVSVKVGSAEHHMQEDHWIQFIEIETTRGTQRKILNPGEKPEVVFELQDEEFVNAYEYCNKHGLWARE